MARITIVLEDTPGDSIQIASDYQPQRGAPCSLAQQAALEIIARTRKNYGLNEPAVSAAEASAAQQSLGMPACPNCGNNRQVWINQRSGLITCHRAHCDTVIEATPSHPNPQELQA